jgi:hypothetical protein
LTCCTQGFLKGFCDIAKVVIIHIIIYPNFSLYLHESSKKTKSFYFFGSLLELNHKNWWFEKKALQNLSNLDHFFPWEILCIGWNYINMVVLLTLHKPGPMSSAGMFLLVSRKLCSGN